MIDFLETHPATVEWQKRRPTCEKCRHMQRFDDGALRCKVIVSKGILPMMRSRKINAFCIDARDTGGACGPAARLFSSK